MKETIKKLAKERGLTMARLSANLLLYKQTFNKMISGNPTVKTLEKVAQALNVEIPDLFPRKVSGFLEYNGKIVKIHNVEDIKKALEEIRISENQIVK